MAGVLFSLLQVIVSLKMVYETIIVRDKKLQCCFEEKKCLLWLCLKLILSNISVSPVPSIILFFEYLKKNVAHNVDAITEFCDTSP